MKRMKKSVAMFVALLAVAASFAFADDLLFDGWYPWGGIKPTAMGNTVILNGRFQTGGYVNEWLNVAAMRGRTVTLEIRNAGNSKFSEGRLMKITVNQRDLLVRPMNIPNLVLGEYVPASATRVIFTLPNDFDGKIGFVFYKADLKDLQITATYE